MRERLKILHRPSLRSCSTPGRTVLRGPLPPRPLAWCSLQRCQLLGHDLPSGRTLDVDSGVPQKARQRLLVVTDLKDLSTCYDRRIIKEADSDVVEAEIIHGIPRIRFQIVEL